MGLFSFIRNKWDRWYNHDMDDEFQDDEDWNEDDDELWQNGSEKDMDRYFADPDQRTVYVLECLGSMAEASEKMEQCDAEYEAVTSLLLDMEEIENLSNDIRSEILLQAQKIEAIEQERRRIYSKTTQMSEHDISLIEKLEDEIPDGIKKIKEAEDYRRLIKIDLRRLSNERNLYHMKKNEYMNVMANSRGTALIIGAAVVFCILMLIIFQIYLEMDVRIGYILAGSVGALMLTYLYVRYTDAVKGIEKLSKSINKLISVHNTVKIRYINNTNLLQYYYLKYDTESSEELENKWKIYVDEISARMKDEKLKGDLEYYYEKLTKTLEDNNIKDPDIWTHQTKALYDHKEMVEVRHALIARRQKLREQMEYNKQIAVGSKDKIADLARKYPKYSKEISQIVARYKGV